MNHITNAPEEIMRLPVEVNGQKHEKSLKAAALPMKQAMAWLEKARALEQKYLAAKAQPQNLPGVLQEMLAFVASYNEKWPQEAIEDAATPGQVVSAFYRLKEMNDPFEASRAYQQAEEERVFRMLEALGKAAPESLERLVEKHSNPSPTTSVTSEKSSV